MFRPFNGNSATVTVLAPRDSFAASVTGPATTEGATPDFCGARFAVACSLFDVGKLKPLGIVLSCRETLLAAFAARLSRCPPDRVTCSESMLGARSAFAVGAACFRLLL